MTRKKIIFIDLDGTLIETITGETFPKGVWDMKILWNVWQSLKRYVKKNKTEWVFIITNQGGIETGHVDITNWLRKFKYIQSALKEFLNCDDDLGIDVMGAFCPVNDKGQPSRKPNTGMLRYLLSTIDDRWDDFNSIHHIPKSLMVMIGDASGKPGDFSNSDKKTAENFGINYMDVDELIKNS